MRLRPVSLIDRVPLPLERRRDALRRGLRSGRRRSRDLVVPGADRPV